MGPLGSGVRVRRGGELGQAREPASSKRRFVEVHFGRITAVPFVALDAPGKPPANVGGRGEQGLAERGGCASEGDTLERLPVVAAAEAADVAVADDAGLEQAHGSRRDARARPAGPIGACGIERVAQRASYAPGCE